MLLVSIIAFDGSLAKDFDNPSLGVKYTHKGYFTAASSHYIHTIKIPALSKFDENGTYIPILDQSFLDCKSNSILLARMDNESSRNFCEQTRVWRSALRDEVTNFFVEQGYYHEILNKTFKDKSVEILQQTSSPVRTRRFLTILTGVANVLSRVLDSYERLVIAKQIRHLSRNQAILFSNQERIMKNMQSTKEYNELLYMSLHTKLHHYKSNIGKLSRQVIWNSRRITDNNKKRKIVESMIKLMNYVYTIHKPVMNRIIAELKKRVEAFQTIVEGKLPITLVDSYELRQIIIQAQGKLAKYDAKLAVVDTDLLYTMRIVTAQRVGRDLYLSLMLPVTARDLPGTYEIYQIESYPIPTDHSPKTNMSTRMVHLPKYIAEAEGKYIEFYNNQLDSCIRDVQMYQCPFDMPLKENTCASAIYEDNHVEILRLCDFEINPIYEEQIVRELSPGKYLMSMDNTTWIRQCINGTEEIPSCLFCIIHLDCGCQLKAGQYRLMGTFDTCVEQTPSEVTYVFNSAFHYFMAPNQYFEQEIWDAQTGLTWEPKSEFVVENTDTDQVDAQWVDLRQDWSDMLEEGTFDLMPLRTKTRYLNELYIGALIVAGIVFVLSVTAIAACLIVKSKARRWSSHFMKTGGALGFLPTTHAAPVFEAPSYGSVTGALLMGLIVIIVMYLLVWGIRWFFYRFRRTIAPYAWAHGNKLKSILVLELMTEGEFAVIPVAEYFISPDAYLLVYDPAQLKVALEYTWWMTVCRIDYGRDVGIYIDTAISGLTLPQRVKIPWFWRRKIERMLNDENLSVRLTVMVNNINYNECVLPIEQGVANQSQFKRAAMQRTSQKYSGVRTSITPSAPPPSPAMPAMLYAPTMLIGDSRTDGRTTD